MKNLEDLEFIDGTQANLKGDIEFIGKINEHNYSFKISVSNDFLKKMKVPKKFDKIYMGNYKSKFALREAIIEHHSIYSRAFVNQESRRLAISKNHNHKFMNEFTSKLVRLEKVPKRLSRDFFWTYAVILSDLREQNDFLTFNLIKKEFSEKIHEFIKPYCFALCDLIRKDLDNRNNITNELINLMSCIYLENYKQCNNIILRLSSIYLMEFSNGSLKDFFEKFLNSRYLIKI
ncbi:MAG: hypothetical protein ACOYT4_03215 [Nanoarchaeota archaeon]